LINRELEYFKKLFLKLKNKLSKTIILLNSKVEFLFSIVDKAFVINSGKLVYNNDNKIFYDSNFYKYVEMPKIVEFTNYANSLDHDVLEYTDLKELIKELYRNVK
jgi:energy-coupling factor transporter ATP-binding protein EcfA2